MGRETLGDARKVEQKRTIRRKENTMLPRKKIKKKKIDTKEEAPSTSHKKIEDVEKMEEGKGEMFDGYHLIHHGVLQQLAGALSCPVCYGHTSLTIGIDLSKWKGLASCISVSCKTCKYNSTYHSSPVIINNNAKTFDVNQRSVYAMRSIGLGLSALERFCGVMNLPPPVQNPSYKRLSNRLGDSAKIIADRSTAEAATNVVQVTGSTDIGVSVDGSWQRRGCSSLNGVMVAVSTTNFKVLDVEIMSRHCKACNAKESLKENKELYEEWKVNHHSQCNANYSGSAPGMETLMCN